MRVLKEHFNAGRGFGERIKLWRKADIVEGMEPGDARWGFTQARDEGEKLRVISTIRKMSAATPRLTWLIYDEENSGKEFTLKGGKPAA